MVHEGVSEALLGRALHTNEKMCAALEAWDATSTTAAALLESSEAILLDVAPAAVEHPPAAMPTTSTPRSNNPFGSSANPFSSANDLTMLHGPDVTTLQHEVQQLKAALEDAKTQHAQQLAAMQREHEGGIEVLRAQVSALRGQLADERRRAEKGTRRIAELAAALDDARGAQDALQARVRCACTGGVEHVAHGCACRQLGQEATSQQQEMEALQAQLHASAVADPEPRSHSAVEWRLLAGAKQAPSFSSARGGSRRGLAHADSFTSARDAVPQGEAAAELLAAYRRMPALRVRMTPQHFTSLVTTVSETW